ncbi:diaminopimelate epimerase [candidate division TA06 bacterium]|uniref:Diaminopimelate epimerase n=1 Tax=candidate division TA06 bacterium TaxID=2250710 RepID=A0A933IAP3_UNCT6|nr:diaminopimelate epimerase [candidate division TA06 bacterium]
MNFYKMSGTGNDLVVLDNRKNIIGDGLSQRSAEQCRSLVPKLCHRRHGVGADGVLLLEASSKADFKMRYLNADGGEVSFCGNGGRCIAWFARSIGAAGEKMTFEAGDGLHRAEVTGDRVKLSMNDPADFRLNFILDLGGKGYAASFADTGVPHVVIPVMDLRDFPVVETGRKIRYHQMFEPGGANANFIELADQHHLNIRTYERGVEDETLACGTGSTAAAVISGLQGRAASPVACLTRGGETLTVHFRKEEDRITEVFLEGAVNLVFKGDWLEETC